MSVLMVVLATYFIFQFAHYASHRWLVHRQVVMTFFDAHVRGHHRTYRGKDYARDRYQVFGHTMAADVLVSSVLVAAAFGVLPLHLFAVFTAESAVLGFAISRTHRAFHTRGHWIKKLPVFAYYDRMHAEHHRQPRTNYGFLFLGFDRLLGTFAPIPSGRDLV